MFLLLKKEGTGSENEEYASPIEPTEEITKEEQVKKKYIRIERTCEQCGKVTKDLRRHLEKHIMRNFKCDPCGKYFAEKGKLKRHNNVHHINNVAPLSCSTYM